MRAAVNQKGPWLRRAPRQGDRTHAGFFQFALQEKDSYGGGVRTIVHVYFRFGLLSLS